MPGNVQVMEEATLERSGHAPDPRSWAWLVAAFLVGSLSGAVFFGPVVGPVVDPDGASADPLVPPDTDVGPIGIARAIPGFSDALVAITTTQPTGPEYVLWPPARGPSMRGLPFGNGASGSIDPSGIWVAALTPLPDAHGGVLMAGRSTSVNPVVSDVDSYAWHETAPGTIGFIRYHEGSWGVWRVAAFPFPQLVADLGAEPPGSIVAYAEWGWVLQAPREVVVVADAEARRLPGRFLDARDRDILVFSESNVMLSRGSAMMQIGDRNPGVIDAAISPDGHRVAVLDNAGVTLVHVEGAVPPAHHALRVTSSHLAWSSDSRFLLVPGSPRGVRVIDTQTGESSLHLTDYTVLWVGVIPLGGQP